MAWTSYRVNLRILSPIHIGWKKTGNLQQTYPYVIGQTLWGALTARLVRDNGGDNYQEIGKEVDKELRFTYFYPTIDCSKIVEWQWDNPDKFSWMYLGSYASVALKDRVSKEGMLHETEYISPKTRDRREVYLVGYIIEKDGCKLKWREALNRIQIGGELGYGWGRVKLIDRPKKSNSCFNSYAFDGTRDTPQITVQGDKLILLAHTLVVDGLDCNGTIEPLVGRETDAHSGFGGVISGATICWVPGSCVKEKTTFGISDRGIWKRHS